MPGSEFIRDGGADPRWNIEGSTNAHASNIWVTDASPDEVVAWYTAELEGWTPDVYPHITMLDGHFPEHAWRRDELVIALGFPDPSDDAVNRLELNLEGRTVYHTSITYQTED